MGLIVVIINIRSEMKIDRYSVNPYFLYTLFSSSTDKDIPYIRVDVADDMWNGYRGKIGRFMRRSNDPAANSLKLKAIAG